VISGVGVLVTVAISGESVAGPIEALAAAEADAAALGSSVGLFERTARTTASAAIATPPLIKPTINPDLPRLPFGGPAMKGVAAAAGLIAAFDATVAVRGAAAVGAEKPGISGMAAVA
jgi:hypothetical protein